MAKQKDQGAFSQLPIILSTLTLIQCWLTSGLSSAKHCILCKHEFPGNDAQRTEWQKHEEVGAYSKPMDRPINANTDSTLANFGPEQCKTLHFMQKRATRERSATQPMAKQAKQTY